MVGFIGTEPDRPLARACRRRIPHACPRCCARTALQVCYSCSGTEPEPEPEPSRDPSTPKRGPSKPRRSNCCNPATGARTHRLFPHESRLSRATPATNTRPTRARARPHYATAPHPPVGANEPAPAAPSSSTCTPPQNATAPAVRPPCTVHNQMEAAGGRAGAAAAAAPPRARRRFPG